MPGQGRQGRRVVMGESFWLEERPGGEGEACVGGGWRLPARICRGSRGG